MKKTNYSINKDYICHLLFQTFEIPVRFLDENKNIVHEYISNAVPNPFYSSVEEQLNELYWDDDPFNFPVIRTTDCLEHFILIHMRNKEGMEGTFIIGPSIYPERLKKIINRIMNDFHVITSKQEVMHYYQSIPIIKKSTLIHVSILLYYMIYFKKIDVNTVVERNKYLKSSTCKVENPDLYISVCHQNDYVRNEVSISTKMFEAIKAGNKEELLKYWNAFPRKNIAVFCVTSELRNRKNQAIAGIAIATRYAIDGGLPSEMAFSLSELYIQNLEKLNDVNSILILVEKAFCIFTEHVKTYSVRNYSKTIITCQNYILKNIYQEISLKKLAYITDKNPMYLSTLFKKEVGMPLSEYIQREKVEEAKKLLTLTNYSLLDISTWLNFNSQSYFTKIFKKYTEVTPKQYRNQYTIY
ncbi:MULTISPECIES: helix-turn-helix domain-containing protein [Bacillus cereus group]|uniref:AraC family transcriptional regulator n=1 Tax=Bacillus thuringiensis serovar mexicanensis TaxID=180868 RepID=A0A242WAA7_BACTU|nr:MULTISPECIES: helix-turn-helix domain-containing protein [Bacillus cereus group]EEM56712.1 Helix-turn-helix-domain containing protein AraC type [Bacillus thuringiensis serovar monterrey BGSC 4AJ1]MEB9673295.1 AraC family transcriptional regulator [Bacillus anthracis]OTW50733.1 AraC family transcriptional regulator [Bacillus thuringiensis serovar mexicanensis]OTX09418.1 AraC family transcriptional regulator [Bacillus thuringiensis serovar monterrey]